MSVDNLLEEPHALFGALLMAEGGTSLDRLGQIFGIGRKPMAAILDQARNGECGRVEAAYGMNVPGSKLDGKGPVAAVKSEVLVQRWMRRISRHLHRHGAITMAQMNECILDRDCGISAAFHTLRTEFARLGISFEGRARAGVVPAVVRLDDAGRKRLAEIVAADWRIEVAR